MPKQYIVSYGKDRFLKVNNIEESISHKDSLLANVHFNFNNDSEIVEKEDEATHFDDISLASFFNQRIAYRNRRGTIKKVGK